MSSFFCNLCYGLSNEFLNKNNYSKVILGDEMEEKLKEIIFDNRDLIYSVIHRFKGSDYDDLFQVGCVGVLKAYQNFKEEYNVKFTTYAYQFIVGEVYKYLVNNRNIHMSPVNIKLLNSIKRGEDALTSHFGRNPNDEELANFLEIDLYKLAELRNMSIVDSLDYAYEKNDLYDFISRNDVSKDELIDLKEALKSLTSEEKKIIRARYYQNITQIDLAKTYHTNQVKISRDEKKILCKLKAKMK